MAWKSVESVEGIEDVFTGYDFSGDSDWNDDSVNLHQPGNAEMTVSFKVPNNVLDDDSTELFFLIGLNWLSESDDCKFEVLINDQVNECHPIRLSADEDAPLVYHVPVATSLLKEENHLKLVVKSGLSPLQVHSYDLRVKAQPGVAMANETLKLLRTATYGLSSEIANGEHDGESIFDPEAQKRCQVTSENADESQVEAEACLVEAKPTSASIKGETDQSAIGEPANDKQVRNEEEEEQQIPQLPEDSYNE